MSHYMIEGKGRQASPSCLSRSDVPSIPYKNCIVTVFIPRRTRWSQWPSGQSAIRLGSGISGKRTPLSTVESNQLLNTWHCTRFYDRVGWFVGCLTSQLGRFADGLGGLVVKASSLESGRSRVRIPLTSGYFRVESYQ